MSTNDKYPPQQHRVNSTGSATKQSAAEQMWSELEPGQRRRDLLRPFFQIINFGFIIPFLAVWTVGLSILSMPVALFSRRAQFHIGTLWAWVMCRVALTPVSIVGQDNADPDASYVLMSNHQSHFDVLAFYGHYGRQFRWVLKEELRNVPGLGWFCAAGGHLFIDRSSREKAIASLKRAAPLLKGGISVMIFPEGTRSTSGRMLPFKKGGFMMALDLGLPILPVSISGSRHVLPNKTLWVLPSKIEITIHEPVQTAEYGLERRDELMAEVRRRIASGLSDWERAEED